MHSFPWLMDPRYQNPSSHSYPEDDRKPLIKMVAQPASARCTMTAVEATDPHLPPSTPIFYSILSLDTPLTSTHVLPQAPNQPRLEPRTGGTSIPPTLTPTPHPSSHLFTFSPCPEHLTPLPKPHGRKPPH